MLLQLVILCIARLLGCSFDENILKDTRRILTRLSGPSLG